jgi:hypothetical protein
MFSPFCLCIVVDSPIYRTPHLNNIDRFVFSVAYVKYDKASSAAAAIEALNGAVMNEGRGPKLKVLLAEAPTR